MAHPAAKLFVGGLPFSKTEADVSALFCGFGEIVEVVLLRKGDGSSKGAGFVTYASPQSAANATMHLQGYVFEGSSMSLNVSVASSGGGGMGGKGGGGAGQPRPNVAHGGGKGRIAQQGIPASAAYQKGGPSMKSQQGTFAGQNVYQQLQQQQGTFAGQQPQKHQDVPGSKCFVGQLPFSKGDADIMQLFSSVGPVQEVVLLKDKATGEKKGAAIVRFGSAQHAAAAVTALNGFLFNGSTRPIKVDIAQGQIANSMGTFAGGAGKRAMNPYAGGGGAAPPGAKLFVGQLPFSKTDGDITELFQHYGSLLEVSLHRNGAGQKTGGAFISFSDAESASAALELDGFMFPGATRPIAVSLHQKKARMA